MNSEERIHANGIKLGINADNKLLSLEKKSPFDLFQLKKIRLQTMYADTTKFLLHFGTTYGSNKSRAINSLLNLDKIDYILADKFKVLTFCISPAFRVENSNSFRFVRGGNR